MPTQTNIIFYDVKSRLPHISTSINTWRVRFVLDYKQLKYETVWLEAPDIEESHIANGIPPLESRADGSPRYTVPALIDLASWDNPIRLTDSQLIIEYLERTYPSQPDRVLYPPHTRPFQALAARYFMDGVFNLCFPLMLLKTEALQTDRGKVMMREIYEPMFGKKIEDMVPNGEEREEAWKKVRGAFEVLASFGEQCDDSPFFAGPNPCFFDFHIAAALVGMKISLGQEFERELGSCANGRWIMLLNACLRFTKTDISLI